MWKNVSRRRITSFWMDCESSRTGCGGAVNEYDVSVGWIMISDVVTSCASSWCLYVRETREGGERGGGRARECGWASKSSGRPKHNGPTTARNHDARGGDGGTYR